jgi:hypothetical protein
VHNFRQWTEQIEKQKENLMRMVVLTNPAVLNGENPYDVKTDYTRAILRYYDLMIDTVSGVALNGNDPNVPLNAQDVVDGKFNEKGNRSAFMTLSALRSVKLPRPACIAVR